MGWDCSGLGWDSIGSGWDSVGPRIGGALGRDWIAPMRVNHVIGFAP